MSPSKPAPDATLSASTIANAVASRLAASPGIQRITASAVASAVAQRIAASPAARRVSNPLTASAVASRIAASPSARHVPNLASASAIASAIASRLPVAIRHASPATPRGRSIASPTQAIGASPLIRAVANAVTLGLRNAPAVEYTAALEGRLATAVTSAIAATLGEAGRDGSAIQVHEESVGDKS